jgi:hypothetical protein
MSVFTGLPTFLTALFLVAAGWVTGSGWFIVALLILWPLSLRRTR